MRTQVFSVEPSINAEIIKQLKMCILKGRIHVLLREVVYICVRRHFMDWKPLLLTLFYLCFRTPFGKEFEVTAHTVLDSHRAETDVNHWQIVMNEPGDANMPVQAPQWALTYGWDPPHKCICTVVSGEFIVGLFSHVSIIIRILYTRDLLMLRMIFGN